MRTRLSANAADFVPLHNHEKFSLRTPTHVLLSNPPYRTTHSESQGTRFPADVTAELAYVPPTRGPWVYRCHDVVVKAMPLDELSNLQYPPLVTPIYHPLEGIARTKKEQKHSVEGWYQGLIINTREHRSPDSDDVSLETLRTFKDGPTNSGHQTVAVAEGRAPVPPPRPIYTTIGRTEPIRQRMHPATGAEAAMAELNAALVASEASAPTPSPSAPHVTPPGWMHVSEAGAWLRFTDCAEVHVSQEMSLEALVQQLQFKAQEEFPIPASISSEGAKAIMLQRETFVREQTPLLQPFESTIKPLRVDIAVTAAAKEKRPARGLLVLMRGLPGSGKSRIAKALSSFDASTVVGKLVMDPQTRDAADVVTIDEADHAEVEPTPQAKMPLFSADDELMLSDGRYGWHPSLLPAAHARCYAGAVRAMAERSPVVVVDNTHTVSAELKPYVEAAVALGYAVCALEANTPWAKNVSTLAKKTSHGVPAKQLTNMLRRYHKNVNSTCLRELNNARGGKRSPQRK